MKSELFSYINPSIHSSLTSGRLSGKSIAVQPSFSVRGWPSEAGSVALRGYVAIEDATVIDRVKKEGATIIGSTRMDEMGFGLNRDTSGRTLSEGHVPLVFMTDMMGEARVTASLIGKYAFKPTGGIVSRYGLIGLVPSMECIGVLAHSPEDIVTVMETISGFDDCDYSMCDVHVPDFNSTVGVFPKNGDIGVVKECLEMCDEGELNAFHKGLERIRAHGFYVKEVRFPDSDLLCAIHQIIGSVEASSSCGKYDGVRYGHRTANAKNWNEMYLRTRAEAFGLLLKTYLFQGAYFQFENYAAFEKACRIRARMVKNTENLLSEITFLALPTTRRKRHFPATHTIEAVYHDCAFTLPANLTGLPSVQIPGYVSDGKADLGLQLIGARRSDARLLRLAIHLSHAAEGG